MIFRLSSFVLDIDVERTDQIIRRPIGKPKIICKKLLLLIIQYKLRHPSSVTLRVPPSPKIREKANL